MQAVKSRIFQVKQDYKEARAAFFPVVDLVSRYGREQTRNFSTGEMYETLTVHEVTTDAVWNIFNGLGDYYNVRSNKLRILSAKFQYMTTAENLALETSQAFLDVLRERRLVKIAKRNVERHRNYVHMISRRAEEGLGREADLAPAKGRLALAINNLYVEENRYHDAIVEYRRFVNELPKYLHMPRPPKYLIPRTKHYAEHVALRLHPAVLAAKTNYEVRKYQYKSTHSAFYPQLDLVGTASYGKNFEGIESRDDLQAGYLRLRYNLFRGGADIAASRRAAYEKVESLAQIGETQRAVIASVGLSWNALQASRKQLKELYQHQVRSYETVIAYRKQFTLGKRTLIDLLNAESEYFNAQRAYVTGKFEVVFSEYRLFNSMGILLKSLHINIRTVYLGTY